MRSSIVLVLAVLALSAVLARSFITVPVALVEDAQGLVSNRRYFLDPANRLPAHYAALLNIGGENYRLLLDTGYGNTYLSAAGCTIPSRDCDYSTNYYNRNGTLIAYAPLQCTTSFTYQGQNDRCRVSTINADGTSMAGVARNDSLEIGPYNTTTTFVSAIVMSENLIVPGSDGVWGLARPNPNSLFLQNGPLASLFAAGMPKLFSLCLTAYAGELHLGGYNSAYASTEMMWLSLNLNQAQYVVSVASVQTGSTTVPNSGGLAVFHTGITFSLFPTAVHDAIVSYIQTQCPDCPNVFGSYAATNPDIFPSFSIAFTDVSGASKSLTFTGRDYLYQHPTNPSLWVAAFTSSNSPITLGQILLRNLYAVFDLRYGVLGLARLANGKCSAPVAAPLTPLTTISPSGVKPPVSTGGITEVPNSNFPLPPAIPTPAEPSAPTSTPTTPAIIPSAEPFTAPTPPVIAPEATPSEQPTTGPQISPFIEPLSTPIALDPNVLPAFIPVAEPSEVITPSGTAPNVPTPNTPTSSSSTIVPRLVVVLAAMLALLIIHN